MTNFETFCWVISSSISKRLIFEECFVENEPFSIFIKLQKNAKISISKGEEEGDEKSQFPYIHNNAPALE